MKVLSTNRVSVMRPICVLMDVNWLLLNLIIFSLRFHV